MQVAQGCVVFDIRLPTGEHVARHRTYLAAVQHAQSLRQFAALEVWSVYSSGARYGVAVFPQLELWRRCQQQLDEWELLHKEHDDELAAIGRTVEPQF